MKRENGGGRREEGGPPRCKNLFAAAFKRNNPPEPERQKEEEAPLMGAGAREPNPDRFPHHCSSPNMTTSVSPHSKTRPLLLFFPYKGVGEGMRPFDPNLLGDEKERYCFHALRGFRLRIVPYGLIGPCQRTEAKMDSVASRIRAIKCFQVECLYARTPLLP